MTLTTWSLTCKLRWIPSKEFGFSDITQPRPMTLQQALQCHETGELKRQDVLIENVIPR